MDMTTTQAESATTRSLSTFDTVDTGDTGDSRDARDAVDTLRRVVAGPVLTPGDAGYDDEVATFNQFVTNRPPVAVGAVCAAAVAAAVRYAIRHELSVAVQSTGHGASFPVEDGILIN